MGGYVLKWSFILKNVTLATQPFKLITYDSNK